jgi:Methylamine utilisation protein MauE
MSSPTLKWITILAHLARVILGVVFLLAAVPKIINMDAFATSIYFYQFLPNIYIGLLAVILPGIELVSVFGLALKRWRPAAELLMTAMMVVFILAVSVALIRGLDIECGCFSTTHPRKLSSILLLQDIGLLILCVFCLVESYCTQGEE